MKPIHVLYAVLLGSLIIGCGSLRQEVEPKGITQQPEAIVVACFISPQDSVLAARVTRSSPVLGVNGQIGGDIVDAVVVLSDGSQSVRLRPARYNTSYGYPTTYFRASASSLPILVGKTYTLTVQTTDGRSVKATCTVPDAVPVEQITVDSSITTDFGERRKEYHARLRWRDPAGQPNFYRVAGNNEYKERGSIYNPATKTYRDTLFRRTGEWYFDGGSLSADVSRDGQLMTSTRARLPPFSYSRINGVWVSTPPSGRLDGYLLNVDENYYRYHDGVARQNEVRDNPFAEPVPIPTNIQGGLGCFGAYNRSTLTLYLK